MSENPAFRAVLLCPDLLIHITSFNARNILDFYKFGRFHLVGKFSGFYPSPTDHEIALCLVDLICDKKEQELRAILTKYNYKTMPNHVKDAFDYGNDEIVKIVVRHYAYYDNLRIWHDQCFPGSFSYHSPNLNFAKGWISALNLALISGHFTLAKWIYEETIEDIKTNTYMAVIKKGYLEIYKWMYEHRKLKRFDKNGAIFLIDNIYIDPEENEISVDDKFYTLQTAVRYNQLEIAKWAYENTYCPVECNIATFALEHENMEMLKWAFELNTIPKERDKIEMHFMEKYKQNNFGPHINAIVEFIVVARTFNIGLIAQKVAEIVQSEHQKSGLINAPNSFQKIEEKVDMFF